MERLSLIKFCVKASSVHRTVEVNSLSARLVDIRNSNGGKKSPFVRGDARTVGGASYDIITCRKIALRLSYFAG